MNMTHAIRFHEHGGPEVLRWEKVGAGDTDPFYPAKLVTARFYAEHVLVAAQGLAAEVLHGGTSALALDESQF
jgi:hypothetical protein